MRIGIFGGTFNPPHMGHIAAARAAVEGLSLDLLYLVPTNIPPHKPLPEGSATPEQRLEMTRLAAKMIPNALACGIEIEREGASYTFETVRQIANAHPNAQIWLIVGTDMLQSFERWREPQEILRRARLAAVCRGLGEREIIARKASELRESLGAETDVVENIPLTVSSTELRAGEKLDAVPGEIAEYIEEKGLYGAKTLENLRQRAKKALSPRRFEHTIGCESCAARLAELHGENVLDARKAAILHDITKEQTAKEQLQMCGDFGIMLDYTPETLHSLIHSDTASEIARREFEMPQKICDAIKYHSTGRAGMSKLEKIIFVADKIEPTRTFADLPPIRALAQTNLDAATLEVLRQSVLSLERRGIAPHERTAEAIKYLENHIKEGKNV